MRTTEAERLYIHRRRLELSQPEMADILGVPTYVYVEAENGDEAQVKRVERARKRTGIRPLGRVPPLEGVKPLGRVSPLEQCVLQRRRGNITQAAVAKALGVSRLWVNRMERGLADPARLIAYWSC